MGSYIPPDIDQINDLKDTFLEEYGSAKVLRKMNKLKSSVILLSKSVFALCDYTIYKKYGKLPKNHSDRFRILKLKENKIYQIVDSVWSKYTDTYSKPSQEESFNLLNRTVAEIVENEEFDQEIKDLIKE